MAASTPAPSTSTPSVPGKARPGELRARIAGILATSPQGRYTVTELAKQLGHSGGAVGNACETLVTRGEAERLGDKPRIYRATSATAAAAKHTPATTPPSAPRPPQAGAVPAPAPPPSGRPGPVTRPNGQRYHSRALANLPDVEALQRLREASVPVLLYGPPGTGKTS